MYSVKKTTENCILCGTHMVTESTNGHEKALGERIPMGVLYLHLSLGKVQVENMMAWHGAAELPTSTLVYLRSAQNGVCPWVHRD